MTSKFIKKSRKAAEPSSGNAAVMVLIIAGAIIIYLLGIPPADRADLLGENSETSIGSSGLNGNSNYEKMLIKENIGRLTKMPFSEKDHEMSAIRVDSTTNAESILYKEGIYIRNSVFTKNFPEVEFEVDPTLSDNLKLSFNLEKASGVLSIYLNGFEVFSGEMQYSSPPAIELPSEYLNERNKLTFYLYRPSWAIWKINEYEIRNFNILGDITDISRSAATVDFAINEIEYESIEESTMYFLPDCDAVEVGKLSIFLNDRKIFSAIPDCGIQNYLILDKYDLTSGKNRLGFKTEKGQYLIDQIRVKTKLEDQVYPIYYFDMQDYHFYSESGDDDDDEEYKYFCDSDDTSILLEYEGEIENPYWDCPSDEDCLGNFKWYSSEKSESTVENAICEELDEDEYKYMCGEDDHSIYVKHDGDLDNTGWDCTGGRTCKENEEIYDYEKLEAIVVDDLCEYQDEDDEEDFFGDYELKNKYDVEVTLRFPNRDYKELTVWVNGFRREVSTTKSIYEFQIDPYIFSGSNSIELIPRTSDVSVSELQIKLVED